MYAEVNVDDVTLDMGQGVGKVSLPDAFRWACMHKIRMIKFARAIVPNLGLKEAKDMVEDMGELCKHYHSNNMRIEHLERENVRLRDMVEELNNKITRIQKITEEY